MRQLGVSWRTFRGQLPRGDEGPIAPLDQTMATHVARVLRESHGRVEGPTGAAARLAVNPHTLRARMRKLGVNASSYRPAPTRASRAGAREA